MDGACRARERAPGPYQPRRPSQSVLYRCVQEHLETWLAQCRDGDRHAGPVPAYVEREFRRYLECGILPHGFARGQRRLRYETGFRRAAEVLFGCGKDVFEFSKGH